MGSYSFKIGSLLKYRERLCVVIDGDTYGGHQILWFTVVYADDGSVKRHDHGTNPYIEVIRK